MANRSSPVRFRDGTPADADAVHAINQANVPAVGAETPDAMRELIAMAASFRVAEDERGVAGFLLALTPEAPYGSGNFLWFRERYPSFVYVDRIAIREDRRGAGLGRRFYEDLAGFAAGRAPILTCEVNTRPRNEGSLRFHARLGFEEVGTRESDGGKKTVVMLVQRLPEAPAGDPPRDDA
ncbi:GNAT family N-acetyltransferase [bacterium]|nr:GNAT family N-acetyltransferase [bacterium]